MRTTKSLRASCCDDGIDGLTLRTSKSGSLTRNDVVAFSRMLQSRGLAPQTRGRYLAQLRRYLFYLSDQGLLTDSPANLIRAADFPKPPSLLPRALPPHVDAELRARLAAVAARQMPWTAADATHRATSQRACQSQVQLRARRPSRTPLPQGASRQAEERSVLFP